MPPMCPAAADRCALESPQEVNTGSVSQPRTAFAAESFVRLVGSATLRAANDKRGAAARTEFAAWPVLAATF